MSEAPPVGAYESLRDWIAASRANANAGAAPDPHKVVYAARAYPLTVPQTVGAPHPVFAQRHLHVPEAYVAVIPEGRFWAGPDDATAVVAPDNRMISDVSTNFIIPDWSHPIGQTARLPSAVRRDETVAVLSFVWSRNYFHWMLDAVGRLRLLKQCGVPIDKYIVLGGEAVPFQEETLAMLGIPPKRVIRASNGLHLRARRLVVPSLQPYRLKPFTVNPVPKWAVDFLRKRLLQAVEPERRSGFERIYISRGDAGHRKVLNEPDVVRLLERHGFRTVSLTGMSVADQVRLFASARTIVAPHGASLTNLMFCRPGAQVVDIFAPRYMYPCFWHISSFVGLDYYYLIGQGKRLSAQEGVGRVGHVRDDLTVDLGELADMLRLLGP